MEPAGDGKENMVIAGVHCFRLMVLRDFKKIEVIEQTTDHMLTAPTWSPDGKRICYLRIPLMTREALKKLEKTIEERSKALDMVEALGAGARTASRPASSSATMPTTTPALETTNGSLPPFAASSEFYRSMIVRPWPAMQIVVRDGRTLKIISTKTVQLPLLKSDTEIGNDFLTAYVYTRPQYDPDGKWVYLCIGGAAVKVDPSSGEHKLLTTPAALGSLSPNGKTLATLGEK